MVNGIVKILNSKQQHPFIMSKSVNDIGKLMNNKLPTEKEVYKFISVSGGFSSVSFIKYVADHENINELTASTLRVGDKQFDYLKKIKKIGKLNNARFFIGSVMKCDAKSREGKYGCFNDFNNYCKENNWKTVYINNHSKILLMKTDDNFYVLETSSNLNENPKIEQYSFENSKALYDFYYDFFTLLEKR
ncbi:MAG: hypothetical protein RSC27_04645 [Bacilli bacterium]